MVKRFEWDEAKAASTASKRGLLFEDAPKLFRQEARMISWMDGRSAAEYRHCGLGLIDGRLFHVTFTIRHAGYRIISFRKASKNERKAYQEVVSSGAEQKGKKSKKYTRPFFRQDFPF